MSRALRFDDSELVRVMCQRGEPKLIDSREGRVKLIGKAAQMLLASGDEAGLFTGGALLAWLTHGGRLERYFRVGQRGSHATAQRLWTDSLIDDEDKSPDGAADS